MDSFDVNNEIVKKQWNAWYLNYLITHNKDCDMFFKNTSNTERNLYLKKLYTSEPYPELLFISFMNDLQHYFIIT